MTSIYSGETFNMARQQFENVADFLDLRTDKRERIFMPKRAIAVTCPIHRDDGTVAVYEGYRVQHHLALGPTKGGTRFAPGVDMGAIRVIPFLFVCYLFNYLDRVNVGFAKLQMLDELRMTETVYGLGAGIFFIGYLACGVPSNLALQHFGARRWISVMMVAWGLFSTTLMFVKTPTEFYAVRFLTGASEAGFFPGIVLYLTRWFPRAQQGRVMTFFMAAIPISGVLGGPVSGWILAHFSRSSSTLAAWQWLYLLQGLPTVLLGFSVWFILSDGIEAATWLDSGERAALQQNIAFDESSASPAAADSLGDVIRNLSIWSLGIVYFCIQSGVYAINFWLPTIIKSNGEANPFTIGLMSAVPYLAAVLFMLAMGRSADLRSERRWHLAVPLIVGAAGLLIAATTQSSPIVSLAGMTLAAMGALTGLPMFWPLTNRYLTASAAAGGLALINSIGQIAGFASPYLVGRIKDATGGTSYALMVLAVAMLVGATLALRVPAQRASA
ncbi:MFS transporter [Sphingomonas bacterium]|uniref:MFS transporter n=1 Tax=Sphingomonas bacterium TaxID=1895847 RepID=UPI001C2D3FA3|nr:MFS transporter [Sphingomonas bacterium]